MDFLDILYSGGLIGLLILFFVGLWLVMILMIPFILLGIYRQSEETNRLLTVLAKRTRTGEDSAVIERLDAITPLLSLVVQHAEYQSSVARTPDEP